MNKSNPMNASTAFVVPFFQTVLLEEKRPDGYSFQELGANALLIELDH